MKGLHVPILQSPFDVNVSPIGAHEYPSLDRAFLKVVSSDPDQQKTDVKVKVSQEGHKLSVKTDNLNVKYENFKNVTQNVKLPMVHNVNVVGKSIACIKYYWNSFS
jgi:hypothetical protein